MFLFSKSNKASSPTKKKHSDQSSDSINSPADSPTETSFGNHSRSANPPSSRGSKTRPPAGRASPRSSRTSAPGGTGSRRKLASRQGSLKDLADDTHPLNLTPEERSRRLSAMGMAPGSQDSADAARDMMDASPAPQPAPSPPPFNSPNGDVQMEGNDDYEENSPIPPPHRTPSSSEARPPPVDAEACKAAGNKFFKLRDYPKAIAEYTKAIDAEPQNPTYLSNRSAAYMGASRYTEALADARRADELEPGNTKVELRMARIYTALGRPTEALECYSRINPPVSTRDSAPAAAMQDYVQQAEAALREGTAGSMALHALDMAEKGLGVGVQKPRKWMLMRGEAYLRLGNVNALGEAQNVAMSLLRQNNQDPEALVLRGRALYAQGENEKAIQHFRQALSCDPDYKEGVKYLRMVQKLDRMKEDGNAAFKAGRTREAVKIYTDALEVDPLNKGTNSKLLHNRALASIKLREFSSALDDCSRALQLDPSYLKARKTRARAMGESGDWESAAREYKEIADENPNEPGAAKDVRHAELELKKSKRKDYYKILNIEKDCDDGQIKRAYRKLAIVHHPDKNPDDPEAAERFKDVGEAYETLSDPQKRARYDSGEDLIDPSEMFGAGGGMGGGVQIDPEMLFNMMGGMGGMGGGGGGPFGGGGARGGGPQFRFSGGGGSPFGGGRGGFPGFM